MKIYSGERSFKGISVSVDGKPLPSCEEIRKISDVGLEWGADGPATEQLAFAILVDYFGNADKALTAYKPFAKSMVAMFSNDWEITSDDIGQALAALRLVN